MADKKKLTDNQISALSLFYGGASVLTQNALDKGDKVAIMLPTGREFFAAFFGVLLAGSVPVPLYPPARPSQPSS